MLSGSARPILRGEGDDAGAQRLGQHEPVAGLRGRIGGNPPGIDQAGDGEARLDLVLLDAMAADDRHAGLGHFVQPAAEDLPQDFIREACPRETPRSRGR